MADTDKFCITFPGQYDNIENDHLSADTITLQMTVSADNLSCIPKLDNGLILRS